jgi:hypothetical protein
MRNKFPPEFLRPFLEINNIRPTDFIKQRRKELEERKISGFESSSES